MLGVDNNKKKKTATASVKKSVFLNKVLEKVKATGIICRCNNEKELRL